MAFDYTNLYPDTSGNGGYTKSWNYTTVVDSVATCSASGYFNKVASRLGIGDNIMIARVDAFETKNRTTLVEFIELFVVGITGGVVTTAPFTTPLPASPVLTGIPTAPTAAPGTNTTQIATTAYADAIAALKANLASPTLTGVPAAPTAAVDTNTTQLASTAFVLAQAGTATPQPNGVAAVGTSTRYARQDHVHITDATRAPLASPTFTGVPAAPTAAVDTNTTQLATTAMVLAQAAAATPGAVTNTAAVGTATRFARADHVHAYDNTAWTAYTPTITASAGAFTTVSATGFYKVIGKTVFLRAAITITTVGTASGTVVMTLPPGVTTAATGGQFIGGQEAVSVKNVGGQSAASSTNNNIKFYDGTSAIAAGNVILMTGSIEMA